MKHFKQLAAIFLAGLMILPPAPLAARTRKGDKLRNDGRAEEQRGNLQHALELTQQAVAEDPGDPAYTLQLQRIRFELGALHVRDGQKLRDAGKVAEALAEFEKALAADPSSDIAVQEIRRTRDMLDREKNGGKASADHDAGMTPADLARRDAQDRTDSLMPLAQLRPLNNQLIDLKIMNRPRTLFETLAASAGINVVFDPDYTSQQTMQQAQIDLKGTTLESALDQISLVTKSFWKPLNSNTIFVSVDNRNNRTQYTEQVLKAFYLSNTTTPQEIQEILTVLRTVVDVQKVFNYTAQNALIVRADADVMALVDKLISDLDKPRSEVLVDIMVLSVNSTYIRNLTAAFAPNGINSSAAFLPRPGITTPGVQAASTGATGATGATTTASSSSTTIPLTALSRISSADYSVTNLPGAQLEAMLNDSSTRVLQAPQIRATNLSKASIKIGDKIPIATGSFQSGVGAVGAFPSANTQFSFQDVGVNVEITPNIHDNSEVSLHVDLDVSQVKDRIDVGGISQPEITQNKVTADIRLREGEVNLIGGIIKQTDSKSQTGIPGLLHIPVLGRLFSSENVEKDRQELVIALVPHIVRGPDITESNLKGVSAGSSGQIKVSFDNTARRAAAAAASAAAGSAPAAVGPATGAPATAPPATAPLPATAPPATAPPATAPPATAPQAAAPPATAPPGLPPPGALAALGLPGMAAPPAGTPPAPPMAGGAAARVSFQPATASTQLSSAMTISILAENVVNMADVAAQLQYDPKILRIANIVAGDLPGRNLSALDVAKNVLDDVGRADMRVSRGSDGGTISGSGLLFTVVFQAVGRGNTSVALSSLSIRGPAGQEAANTPQPVAVTVQ